MSNTHPERPLRVLHSVSAPDGTTKYADQMKGSAPAGVQPVFFSWRRALTGRYDVLHVHWPELLLRGGRGRALLTRALLARLRVTRRPLVRTLHNVEPHEASSAAEARMLGRIDDATTAFIRMNPATPVRPDWAVYDIPHSDYRTAFAEYRPADRIPGRFAYVGLIRPYKNVSGLLRAFAGLEDGSLSLSVSGKPTPALVDEIEGLAAADPRVVLSLAFVPDADMVRDVTAAELVVLPYLEMHNSGILLVALSLGRPALVPRSASNEAMAAEVGHEWVIQYDGDLTPDVLASGLADARRTIDQAPPRLENRSWEAVGARHETTYRDALRLARGSRRSRGERGAAESTAAETTA